MARVNLTEQGKLTDRHLAAEYNEILMLAAYAKKFPSTENLPQKFCLGKGRMKFFKNKILFLKKRHELLKKETKKRKFQTNKKTDLSEFPKRSRLDWRPSEEDPELVKKRISKKLKPDHYRRCGASRSTKFFLNLLSSD